MFSKYIFHIIYIIRVYCTYTYTFYFYIFDTCWCKTEGARVFSFQLPGDAYITSELLRFGADPSLKDTWLGFSYWFLRVKREHSWGKNMGRSATDVNDMKSSTRIMEVPTYGLSWIGQFVEYSQRWALDQKNIVTWKTTAPIQYRIEWTE